MVKDPHLTPKDAFIANKVGVYVENHHGDSISTSPKKTADQFFMKLEPISSNHFLRHLLMVFAVYSD